MLLIVYFRMNFVS